MPEGIEIEMYRRPLEGIVGSRLDDVELPDPAYLRPKHAPRSALDAVVGAICVAARRVGKLLLLDLVGPGVDVSLGLRFGMTGRLLIDDWSPIDRLEYSSGRNDPAWDRVVLIFGGRRVAVRDPRRLGSIELDPDESALGPDLVTLSSEELAGALRGRRAAIKSVLLDQGAVAGLGNLLVDETLWRVGLAPHRSAASLEPDEVTALASTVRSTVRELDARGGSHTGDTFVERHDDGRCPRDGEQMTSATIGGRTTWWCPRHQR